LAVCTKTFLLFSIFFVFLEVLTKTGYFNTVFVFFQIDRKQTEIKQNNIKQYTQEITNIEKYLFFFFLKWVGLGPDQWAGPDPAQNQMGWLLCTNTVTNPFTICCRT
jgi:hypothetical protein